MANVEADPYAFAKELYKMEESKKVSKYFIIRIDYVLRHGFLIFLQRIFGALGVFIASFPYLFIFATLCLSTISYGVIYVRFAQRLQDGFTSTNSPSRYEEEVSVQFRGSSWTYTQRFVVLLRASDGGSMLRPEYLDRALEARKFLGEVFSIKNNGRTFRHIDICKQYCDINKALDVIKESQQLILEAERSKKAPPYNVIIDHPKSTIHGFQYSVAQHLFGVKRRYRAYEDDLNNQSPENVTRNGEKGDTVLRIPKGDYSYSNRLEHVTMIMLLFYADVPDADTTNIVTQWENEVFEWVSAGAPHFPDLSVDVIGDKVLGREMVRGGLSLIPHLLTGLGLSITFVMISVIVSSVHNRRVDFGKVLVVVGIIVPPLLAVFTTFGIMGLAQIEIYPIQMVIPFLILAIGVDDAFLMLHAWNRLTPAYDHLSGEERFRMIPTMFGKVLEEVGPSITITSLTNAIAFAIGTTVSTPAIQLFCMGATIAMVMDFVFELTLFGALLSLAARLERVCQGSFVESESAVVCEMMSVKSRRRQTKMWNRMLRWYCEVLTMRAIRIVLVTFTFVFFTVSLIGTLRIRTFINAQKIIPSDSRLLRADALFEKYQWREYEPLQIYVNSPPDIGNAAALAELKEMIRDFETLPQAIGPSATMIWLNDYEKMIKEVNIFMGIFGVEVDGSYNSVPEFLRDFPLWNETIRWHRNKDGTVNVTAFYFITGYCNSTSWWDRAKMMLTWRETANRWRKFNVTIYSENSPVFESIFGLKGTTVQTATITLVCMLAVCVLFVPSAAGVITAGWAICSISLGVFGFLSWWGLDLDPVTVSAIVMSIGFSVDYTAHVSYHYQRAQQLLPPNSAKSKRLEYTLDSVGWPMIQAAISTLVCFLPVAFHHDYTPSVFVRTITLVVGWGLLHGLVLLPAILAAVPDCLFSQRAGRDAYPRLRGGLELQPQAKVSRADEQYTSSKPPTRLVADEAVLPLTRSQNELGNKEIDEGCASDTAKASVSLLQGRCLVLK